MLISAIVHVYPIIGGGAGDVPGPYYPTKKTISSSRRTHEPSSKPQIFGCAAFGVPFDEKKDHSLGPQPTSDDLLGPQTMRLKTTAS